MIMSAIFVCLALAVAITADEPVLSSNLTAYYTVEGRKPKDERQHPTLRVETLQRGHVGIFSYEVDQASPKPYVITRVLQVLDDNRMLLAVDIYGWQREMYRGSPGGSGRVALGAPTPVLDRTVVILLSGAQTSNVADGQQIRLSGGFHVTGTHSYESPSGRSTVWQLEPWSLPSLKELGPKPEPEPEPVTRTWTSSDSKYTTEAEYVDQTEESVRLKKTDGSVITVRINKLSKADRDWLRREKTKMQIEKKKGKN
jgi:hypothetical protein